MKFTITDSDAGKVQSDGAVKGAMGGTEMIKLGLLERLDKQLLNQFNIIHSRVRELDLTKKNILVLHDTWDDPEAQHLRDETSRERFAKFVFVSNYQFQTYHLAHGIPFSKSVVMHNAIEPIAKHEKTAGESLRLIYHTTPHRGLELLVQCLNFCMINMDRKLSSMFIRHLTFTVGHSGMSNIKNFLRDAKLIPELTITEQFPILKFVKRLYVLISSRTHQFG